HFSQLQANMAVPARAISIGPRTACTHSGGAVGCQARFKTRATRLSSRVSASRRSLRAALRRSEIRIDLQRARKRVRRFRHPSGLIEGAAEVRPGLGIARVDAHGFAKLPDRFIDLAEPDQAQTELGM